MAKTLNGYRVVTICKYAEDCGSSFFSTYEEAKADFDHTARFFGAGGGGTLKLIKVTEEVLETFKI